jgi:hypothetical protein
MGSDKADPEITRKWLRDRNLARTDLFFLANQVLGYPDINPAVHGPLVNTLQKFYGCDEWCDPVSGKLIGSTPRVPLWRLPPNPTVVLPATNRRTLALMPRGGLKTTTTMAWAIQWIINYPDVRILFNLSSDTRHREIATEILSHFRYNEKFRFYFPEFCPPSDKAGDFGSMDYFNVPNRTVYRRAPTVSFASVGKIIAGPHYEVVIHSDIIDENNCNTPGAITKCLNHFRFCMPLVEASAIAPHTGWVHVEGTVYDFSDVYSHIMAMKDSGHQAWQVWQVLLIDAEKDSQKHISYWPERFPWPRLMEIKEEVGPQIYAANYRQKPVAEGGGLTEKILVTPFFKIIKPILLPKMRLHCTVDLHGMEDNLGNDYTVLNVSGFLPNGQVICLDIRRGHFTPFDVIGLLFEIDETWGGKILDYKIEKDAHMRVLGPFLKREMQVRKRWLNIVPIQRDNTTSKHQRIRGLQSWFAGGVLSFSDQIVCMDEVLLEIKQFPKGTHDDILDTLADHMQNRDGKIIGDVVPSPKPDTTELQRVLGLAKFTGFDPITHMPLWSDETMEGIPNDWKTYMKAGV